MKAVQRRLGDQSAMETLDTYDHPWPDSDENTPNAVNGVTSASCADSARPFDR